MQPGPFNAVAFAAGWSKLPEELKLHILAYLLPWSVGLNYEALPEVFSAFLHMNPETSRLCREILYSETIINVRRERTLELRDDPVTKEMIPAYVRTIWYSLRCARIAVTSSWDWKWFENLIEVSPRLEYVVIVVGDGQTEAMKIARHLQSRPTVLLPFYGKVQLLLPTSMSDKDRLRIEAWWQNKLVFQSKRRATPRRVLFS